jgi:hypothetical protein
MGPLEKRDPTKLPQSKTWRMAPLRPDPLRVNPT